MTTKNEMMTAKSLEGFYKLNSYGKNQITEHMTMITRLPEYTCDESTLAAELEAKKRRTNPTEDNRGAMAKYYAHIDPNRVWAMTLTLGDIPYLEVIHGDNKRHKFPLAEGWQIYICNEFLRSLNTNYYISFEGFIEYWELVKMCMEQLQERRA